MSLVSLLGSGHSRRGGGGRPVGGFYANLNRSVTCSIWNRHKKKPFVFEVYVCAHCCSGLWLDYSLEFNTRRCGEITVAPKWQHKYSTPRLFGRIKGYLKRCDFPFNALDSVDGEAKKIGLISMTKRVQVCVASTLPNVLMRSLGKNTNLRTVGEGTVQEK